MQPCQDAMTIQQRGLVSKSSIDNGHHRRSEAYIPRSFREVRWRGGGRRTPKTIMYLQLNNGPRCCVYTPATVNSAVIFPTQQMARASPRIRILDESRTLHPVLGESVVEGCRVNSRTRTVPRRRRQDRAQPRGLMSISVVGSSWRTLEIAEFGRLPPRLGVAPRMQYSSLRKSRIKVACSLR